MTTPSPEAEVFSGSTSLEKNQTLRIFEFRQLTGRHGGLRRI